MRGLSADLSTTKNPFIPKIWHYYNHNQLLWHNDRPLYACQYFLIPLIVRFSLEGIEREREEKHLNSSWDRHQTRRQDVLHKLLEALYSPFQSLATCSTHNQGLVIAHNHPSLNSHPCHPRPFLIIASHNIVSGAACDNECRGCYVHCFNQCCGGGSFCWRGGGAREAAVCRALLKFANKTSKRLWTFLLKPYQLQMIIYMEERNSALSYCSLVCLSFCLVCRSHCLSNSLSSKKK